jgi:cation diffusion facilitator family transporter
VTASAGLDTRQHANDEKRRVALLSVGAALFLTFFKLMVGLTTGSLGILAEAAHSGLDLAAAVMTLFAVRVSARPADSRHLYGHGKVENLSALFETLLLLVTCLWIMIEALRRLFLEEVQVEVTIWAFVVMFVSIAIDFSRSRALGRVARKYDSQALEADALHFSTDIWSSLVVIAGLALVWLAEMTGIAWLAKADAVAAMGVAGIVVYVSLQLGRRTLTGLLDETSPEAREQVAAAVRVPGVVDVSQVRLRRSGPDAFVDVTLTVSRDTALERAHEIASRGEAAIQEVLPGADVVVHVEPVPAPDESAIETVRVLAARHNIGAHSIRLHDVPGSRSLELHLEVDPALRLEEAHAQVTAFEDALRQALPGLARVVTHIEPAGDADRGEAASRADQSTVNRALASLSGEIGVDCRPHDVQVQRDGEALNVSFHCHLDPNETVSDAHLLSERAEQALRRTLPSLGRLVIHVEPTTETGVPPELQ